MANQRGARGGTYAAVARGNAPPRDTAYPQRDAQVNVRTSSPLSSGINKFSAKLAPKYEGPLKIVEIKSPAIYTLESVGEGNRRIAKVHVSELKRYIPPRKARKE